MTQLATISRRWSAAAAPRPTIPPQEWCEKIRRMKNGARFRWSYAPYLLKPFLSFYDPEVQETALEMFSRAGKSEIILNWIGEGMDQRPRRFLCLWPTVGQAEKWSKDNLTGELLDETPSLNYLGSSAKSRYSGNTILHKHFPGGLLTAFGANSPGEMRRAKGDGLYGDEIDAIEETQTDEGDPLAIFAKRGDEYPLVTRIWASYPSVLGRSRIHAKMLRSDHQQYFVTCVLCGGEPFVMHRRMLHFEEDRPQDARLTCPRCGQHLTDPQRHAMMLQGRDTDCWQPTREFRGIRGFHANSLLWPHRVDPKKFPGGFLEMLARKMIDADHSDNPQRARRIIVNADDAEPFDPLEQDEKPPPWQVLYDRRENYGTEKRLVVPAGALVLTAAIDVQKNRLEVEWEGLGRREEVWGLDHVVLPGEVMDEAVWIELERELRREFDHEIGCKVELSLAFVDTGKWPDWVLRFLRRLLEKGSTIHGKVRACRGSSTFPHPVVNRKYQSIAKTVAGHWIGGDAAKDLIYRRLRLESNDDGTFPEGYRHFPQTYQTVYFEQLVAETVSIEFRNGEEMRRYKNSEHVRNETLDLAVYNLGAQRLRPWNFDAIEADLRAKAEEMRGQPPKPEPVKSRMRRTEGFL